MMDWPTAGVIIAGLIGGFTSAIVAMIQFGGKNPKSESEDDCECDTEELERQLNDAVKRIGVVETAQAVQHERYTALLYSIDGLRKEVVSAREEMSKWRVDVFEKMVARAAQQASK